MLCDVPQVFLHPTIVPLFAEFWVFVLLIELLNEFSLVCALCLGNLYHVMTYVFKSLQLFLQMTLFDGHNLCICISLDGE